ncbi:hypothetical protein O181_064428 [Austropuccinia psidii MF-1]|uniref:Uncharacterized protein n=1 Tax=Austropuccinia psidii MF-1 TaxID=1389203 RepID=A0A9Q3ETH1_9BASI|nr:hypothetical protein [Austropuccinia psidii MF-1]
MHFRTQCSNPKGTVTWWNVIYNLPVLTGLSTGLIAFLARVPSAEVYHFCTKTQKNNQSNILTTILQKMENLEKREANVTLPMGLTTLIMQLNHRIDELIEKQSKMDKIINDLLTRIDNGEKRQQLTNNLVSSSLSDSSISTMIPISFAAAMANTQNRNEQSLPK